MIIGVFLAVLILISNVLKIPQAQLWNDIMIRFGMNAILVLAMVPSIQAGIGINFNLALGVVLGAYRGFGKYGVQLHWMGCLWSSLADSHTPPCNHIWISIWIDVK